MAKYPPSILFCGKHRVNFAMFDNVYKRLAKERDIRLLVSSGCYRRRLFGYYWIKPGEPEHINEDLFAEFGIDPRHFHKTSVRDEYPYECYVSSNLSKRIQPKNSRISVQIYHGVSFRNFAVNQNYTRFDKLFFPGRYMMEQYIERGFLKEGDPRIEPMGLPKLDCLVDGSVSREQVLRDLGLDPALPTVLWCPTGARHNSVEKLGAAGLKAAQAGEWNFILKLHDHPHLDEGVTQEQVAAAAKAALGPRGRLATKSNVAPLLVAADLLISDASSVAYEYCLRDRPILFVDVPELLEHRAGMEKSAMDLNTHGRNIGRVVGSPAELTEAIGDSLKRPDENSDKRRATAQHIFHMPGTATQRMAERLLKFARTGDKSL